MNAVDSHIHWWPSAYFELLARRSGEPRAERRDGRWVLINGSRSRSGEVAQRREWFDLEAQFETLARTGHEMAAICSLGTHSDLDGLPAEEAAEAARLINEEWSATQRRYPGRFFAAAAVPLQDTQLALDELEHAVGALGLRGVSLPSSVAGEPMDAVRLEPFYARAEQLGVPLFVHPTDAAFIDTMPGYDKRLYMSLGRVVDSSVAVLRLVLGGVMARYPRLKVVHFHAGGVLPYAAGRLDKNARLAELEQEPTAYLKRMWVDTAMPHSLTIRMALDFYGTDRVLYGSDNPCWNPLGALEALRALELSEEVTRAVLDNNVRGLVDLRTAAAPVGVAG